VKAVVLAPDLMDRSKIAAVLPDAVFVGAAAQLPAAAVGADLVVIDLSRAGVLEVLEVVVAAAVRVVGFGPHTETSLFTEAGAAGAESMPRSRFFGDLAAALG
jgi:L-alanine-DL-glutamate epimerase-like enolase superfamily enzyme